MVLESLTARSLPEVAVFSQRMGRRSSGRCANPKRSGLGSLTTPRRRGARRPALLHGHGRVRLCSGAADFNTQPRLGPQRRIHGDSQVHLEQAYETRRHARE